MRSAPRAELGVHALIAITMLLGCARVTVQESELGLALGQAQAASPGSQIALVLHPDECLTCRVNLGAWLQLQRTYPGNVHVFLTAEPDAATRGLLARLRMNEWQVVAGDRRERAPVIAVLRPGADTLAMIRATPNSISEVTRILDEDEQ